MTRAARIAKVKGESSIRLADKFYAKDVRKALAAKFVGVRFSIVTSRGYGISVRWTDGPSWENVHAFIFSELAGANGTDLSIDYFDHCQRFVVEGVAISTGTFSVNRYTSKETEAAALAFALANFPMNLLRTPKLWARSLWVGCPDLREIYLDDTMMKKLHDAGIPL